MHGKSRYWFVLGLLLTAFGLAGCSGTQAAAMPESVEIEAEAERGEVEFTGVVESQSNNQWTVSGITFAVTGNTEIHGHPMSGDSVKVNAFLDAEGMLTAREIEPARFGGDDDRQNPAEDEIEFTGTVEAISSGSWTINGVEVLISPATEIKGEIAVGDLVKVHARPNDEGSLVAREIELAVGDDLDDEDDERAGEIEFTGIVEAISSGSWTINGVEVLISSATEIEGEIAVGDLVKVHARPNDEGSLVAREIEPAVGDDLDDEDDERAGEIEFTGIVEAIGATSWTIGGRTVLVTVQTDIEPGIAVGDEVKVHASPNDSGVLVAREIDPAEPDDDDEKEPQAEREFLGTVESISDSAWVIDGVTVTITSQTEIDVGLTVGSMVEVEAFVASDGTLTAEEIERADESDLEDQDEADDDEDDEGEDEDEDDDEDRSGSNSGSG